MSKLSFNTCIKITDMPQGMEGEARSMRFIESSIMLEYSMCRNSDTISNTTVVAAVGGVGVVGSVGYCVVRGAPSGCKVGHWLQ